MLFLWSGTHPIQTPYLCILNGYVGHIMTICHRYTQYGSQNTVSMKIPKICKICIFLIHVFIMFSRLCNDYPCFRLIKCPNTWFIRKIVFFNVSCNILWQNVLFCINQTGVFYVSFWCFCVLVICSVCVVFQIGTVSCILFLCSAMGFSGWKCPKIVIFHVIFVNYKGF